MSPALLYPPPDRLRCYVCGKFTEAPSGWKYKVRGGVYSAVCPSCTPGVEREIEVGTTPLNLPGAVGVGATAAALGAVAWFAFTYLAIHRGVMVWLTAQVLGAGAGLLIGKAVMEGSGLGDHLKSGH